MVSILPNSVFHCAAVIVDPALTADIVDDSPYPLSPVPVPHRVFKLATELSPEPAALAVAKVLYSSSKIVSPCA